MQHDELAAHVCRHLIDSLPVSCVQLLPGKILAHLSRAMLPYTDMPILPHSLVCLSKCKAIVYVSINSPAYLKNVPHSLQQAYTLPVALLLELCNEQM